MKAINVGLIGLGTVGCGTLSVLQRNADEISRRAGRQINVVQVADRDLERDRGIDTSGLDMITDPMAVVNNPEIDIIVELVGGDTIARDIVMAAIAKSRPVVTANKALIALHGNEIFAAANQQGVMVAFEAAVAGGISIIKSIREGLAGNRIEWLAGIINGTSNYILTSMETAGADFGEVLATAQKLGYAEADPSFDIEGIDAAHKLTILASIAYGIPLQYDKVHIEGITAIEGIDMEIARELGYRIKHLGLARRSANGIELRVHPTLIPQQRLLASVDGVMNAIVVSGDAVGQTLHYGAGAGAEPTASAIVADLIDVVRAVTTDPLNRVPHLAFQPGSLAALPILPIDDIETSFYLRLLVLNRPGVLAAIAQVFGERGISINTVIQKGAEVPDEIVSIILLTQRTREGEINDALDQLKQLDAIKAAAVKIRVEELA